MPCLVFRVSHSAKMFAKRLPASIQVQAIASFWMIYQLQRAQPVGTRRYTPPLSEKEDLTPIVLGFLPSPLCGTFIWGVFLPNSETCIGIPATSPPVSQLSLWRSEGWHIGKMLFTCLTMEGGLLVPMCFVQCMFPFDFSGAFRENVLPTTERPVPMVMLCTFSFPDEFLILLSSTSTSTKLLNNFWTSYAADECIFGDYGGLLVSKTVTCAEFVASQPSMCYSPHNRKLCCASCEKAHSGNPGEWYRCGTSWRWRNYFSPMWLRDRD